MCAFVWLRRVHRATCFQKSYNEYLWTQKLKLLVNLFIVFLKRKKTFFIFKQIKSILVAFILLELLYVLQCLSCIESHTQLHVYSNCFSLSYPSHWILRHPSRKFDLSVIKIIIKIEKFEEKKEFFCMSNLIEAIFFWSWRKSIQQSFYTIEKHREA